MSDVSKFLKRTFGIPEVNLKPIMSLLGLDDTAALGAIRKMGLSAGDCRRMAALFTTAAVEKEAKG